MSGDISLLILRIVLALVTCGYGAVLAVAQYRGHTHLPLLILGLAESVAAILLLIPKTLRLGGIALIVVVAFAIAFHVLHGEYSVSYLLVYAAATLAVISNRRPSHE